MAEEEEAKAGLVGKGTQYPKTAAKPAATAEFSQTYRLVCWPPTPSDEQLVKAVENWQEDARTAGLVPSKTAYTKVKGEGGITYVTVTGRVKKASAKES